MRYFLISLGVVLLIIFGVVIFNRPHGNKTANTNSAKTVKLNDFAENNNANVQMNIDGPINAIENHRGIQVLISPTTRILNVFTGYQGQVMTTQTLSNDSTSYKQFLVSLDRALFTNKRNIADNASSNAICPTGNRTHYTVVDNGKIIMDSWNASCSRGTFGGNASLTNSLFQAQIPNYSTLTNNVNVGGSSSSTGLVL